MKYAEALTNLHKSGINKNSTPQEIAAASVGTTVGQNGRPNISSISQGVGYGSALKNLNSNPQPNVNQNSSGAKSNATGSQNNTGNNANTNPTGSTKPSSSANTSRSANPTSSSARLSNADYNRLAAQIVGVPVDRNGNPVCNSYEQYMQFGQTLSNLHNGGINANSTPHEIAAASVGAKNNTPNIFNPSQLMGYSKALLNLLKGTQQVVSYVEPNSNAAKNNSNENVKQTGSSQPVNYKVTNAVSFLAAQNLGISTDSTGTPHISNPSDGKKFMEECDRLRENEDKIMAAAAAGISVDRDGNPRPQNTYEETAYKRAYELLFGNSGKNRRNVVPLLHAEDGMKNTGEEDSSAGQDVDFSKSTYESYAKVTKSWQKAIREDKFENGGYTYIDENGLYRSAKNAGVKSNDDYYIVAMGNGFPIAAEQYQDAPTHGGANMGYTAQVTLQDSSGRTYTIDVLVGDTKGASNSLVPHDHPIEFIVNGSPNPEICSKDNVNYTKLLGSKGVTSITDISVYENGARYAYAEWYDNAPHPYDPIIVERR